MRKIILDTDFLLHNLNNCKNFISEIDRVCDFKYELCVLDRTIIELKGKKGEKLALDFIKKKIKLIKTSNDKSTDNLLLAMDHIIVATHDKELKEKLKKRGIPIIVQRNRKYLVFEDVL